MPLITINNRDELNTINPSMVAAVQAKGNYSRVVYITHKEIMLTLGVSKMEHLLKTNTTPPNRFIRLGRSIIINHRYLRKIDLQKQILLLSDGQVSDIRITVPKRTLKAYKEAIVKSFNIKNEPTPCNQTNPSL